MDALVNDVFNISSENDFNNISLDIFRYQAVNNPVYSRWIRELGVDYQRVEEINEIPFLPISVFRNHKVLSGGSDAEKVFISSGTGGMKRSSHYVIDLSIYERSFITCFRNFYGNISDYVILALLPSYLEREGSSLVYMSNRLVELSGSEMSGFFLDDYQSLKRRIILLDNEGKKVILLGVSFALLDLAEHSYINLENHIVMETGGMKGRREEITREELHSILKERFSLDSVHSEYGMTELLSQAYSKGGGLFNAPAWMKILIRDPHDPFSFYGHGRTGGVNIIDLANIYSCSFIETSDLGISHPDGSFEIVGRFDNSDIRGCNLLI
ncbi:MAG: acyltransferase [Bacteroidales bacterium]|nr:acyltransferase [Bacteroidales bacterium]